MRFGVMFALVFAATAASACGRQDFVGSHEGIARGELFGGNTKTSLDSPNETVEVRKDGDAYVVTVRGCVLRGERTGELYVEFPSQSCHFDVPGHGPTSFEIEGAMSATTQSPFLEIIRATVKLAGEDRSVTPVRRLFYMVYEDD